MKFYTYIGMLKNQIYVRELSENEEHSFKENFQPTMYTTAPSDKCNYTTLNGIPVGHVKFDNIASCKDFIKQYSGTINYPIFGNTNYIVQYISEKYPKKVQWNTNKLQIYTIDIEVSAENGPLITIFFLISFFIAGIIILFSSLILFMLSQCGFRPSTAINGFLFK